VPLNVKDNHCPLLPRANRAVADVLREGIMNGSFEPGERLKEEEIAEALGVSRTPVREAFLVLATEGLIDLPANRGARAVVRVFDVSELAMIYDIRVLLEAYAVRKAAERVTPTLLASLEASCDKLAALPTGDAAELAAENREFHNLIIDAAGSERLSFIAGTMLQVPLGYKKARWADPTFHELVLTGHRRIVAALRLGDGSLAAEQMRKHLEEVSSDFRRRSAKKGADLLTLQQATSK